jgi:hypothetical protein
MQRRKGLSPYVIEVLSSGMCNTDEELESVVVRVAWVVEDRQTRPVSYGFTDYDSTLSSEDQNYRLRATLSTSDVREMLQAVSTTTRAEAKTLVDRVTALMLLEEGIASNASYN